MNQLCPLLVLRKIAVVASLTACASASHSAAELGATSPGSQDSATAAPAQGNAAAKLLRYPHVQGDRLVFVHGGDIWRASADGGRAERLTSYDEGYELFPRLSPDGRWVTFSGEYSGTRQVYLVPWEGGTPRQLTFYPDVGPMPPRGGYDHLPLDWHPDGSRILIKANRTPYGQRVSRYFWVDPWNGGLETPLPLPEGGPASLSPDGGSLAYSIISREWRTWKRYTAGRAQDVHVYDLAANTIRTLTDWRGTDNFPMWIGDWVYYTSDDTPNGRLNLFRVPAAGGAREQLTDFSDFDVLFPSRGGQRIVFEHKGQIALYDTESATLRHLEIQLADDRPWLRPTWKDGSSSFASYDVSPSAKRALVEYRGEVFSAPAEKGEVRNLTRTPGRRERGVRWSPEGTHIAYLAEAGDDYELFLRDLRTGEERALTRDTGAWIEAYEFSPKGDVIALADKANRLAVVDVASGERREIDASSEGTLRSVSWSADGSWLTYVKAGENGYDDVWIAPADPAEGGRCVSRASTTTTAARPSTPRGATSTSLRTRDFDFDELRLRRAALCRTPARRTSSLPLAYEERRRRGLGAEERRRGQGTRKPASMSKPTAEGRKGEPEERKKSEGPSQIELDGLSDRQVAPAARQRRAAISTCTASRTGLLFVQRRRPDALRRSRSARPQDRARGRAGLHADARPQAPDLPPQGQAVPRGAQARPEGRRRSPAARTACACASYRRSSGVRCTSTPGASCAIGSTTPRCTGSTGSRCTREVRSPRGARLAPLGPGLPAGRADRRAQRGAHLRAAGRDALASSACPSASSAATFRRSRASATASNASSAARTGTRTRAPR